MRQKLALAIVAISLLIGAGMPSVFAQWTKLTPIASVTQEADGVRAVFQSGAVAKLQVCTDSMIHVVYSPTGTIPKQTEYVVTRESWTPVQWKLDATDKAYVLSTAAVKVILEKESGAITFVTAAGQPLFRDGKRFMFPETVNGENTYRAES